MEYYSQEEQSPKELFRFQTLRQKQLYTKLRLLGPGPATLYREACYLMTPQQRLESTAHLVAHLLREVESAVRRVLLPYDYTPPDPCSQCGNRPEAHIKQIRAIGRSLELVESLQKTWIEVAARSKTSNGLAEIAHREDLSLPRKIDPYFETVVDTFEAVFDSVLSIFEKQSLDVFASLDQLLLKKQPSKEDLKTLRNKIPQNEATYRYFFERLQFPGWLEPLRQKGVFAHFSASLWDEDLGRPIFSPWPCSSYLLRMAQDESAQQIVLSILHEVAETDNPFVRYDILQIAHFLSASLAAALVPAIQKWIRTSHLQTVDFTQISNFIAHLVEGNESNSALVLLETCLTALAPEESHSELWEYEELVTKHLSSLVKSSAVEMLSLLCRLLEAEIYAYYIRFRDIQEDQADRLQKKAQEASTTSWQRAIVFPQSEVPHGIHDPLNVLVIFLAKAAEQAIQEQSLSVEAVVEFFEAHPGRIFRRLALAILSRFSQDEPELVKRYLLNQTLFNDADVRHEYGLLARSGFSLLSNKEQETLLQWIETGPDLQNYQKWYSQIHQAAPDDELVLGYANVWRRDWLGWIGEGLPTAWRTRYNALVAEYSLFEPEDTGIRYAGWVGPTSVLSPDELRSMTIGQILSFLKTWQPSGNMMSPSREGLGRILTTIVGETPELFAKQAHQFQGYDPVYVQAVVQGFTDAIRSHRSFEWEHVLDLCQWVINQRYSFAKDDNTTIVAPEWAWACQGVAYLLWCATEAQPSVLPPSLRSAIWDILEPLADDPDLSQNDEVDTDDKSVDANKHVTRAINSIQGNALHAVISFAWWLHHQVEEEQSTESGLGLNIMPEVRDVIDRHVDPDREASLAVRSIFGQRLPTLVAIDSQWTSDHLAHLFPGGGDQQALRIVTWNTYIVFCPPYNKVFRLLQEEYAEAIERLDVPKQSKYIVDDPDYRLGEHLIRLYWSGLLPLASPESLLTRFFTKAPDELRAQVLGFIGLALFNTGENTPFEIVERSQRLWEWRLSEALSAIDKTRYKHELAAFGQLFRADICPAEWGMHQLESVLTLVENVEMSYAVVERLAGLVEHSPMVVIKCLDFLVKGDLVMWTTSTWEKAVQPILIYALQREEKEIQQQARAIISYLALHYGMTHLLKLLSSDN